MSDERRGKRNLKSEAQTGPGGRVRPSELSFQNFLAGALSSA